MSHEINHEFPASSHTVTPLPETFGFLGKIVHSIRTRGLRYALVAVVNVVVGQTLLLALQGAMRPFWANIIAVGISAVPAYYMNRAWVWGKYPKKKCASASPAAAAAASSTQPLSLSRSRPMPLTSISPCRRVTCQPTPQPHVT